MHTFRAPILAALFATTALLLHGCGGGGASSGGLSSAGAATGSGPATVTISNSSNETIMFVYFSPVSQSTWGPDQLGSNVIARGQSFTMQGIQPGVWDLRVEDQSGNYKEWRQQTIDPGGQYNLAVSSENWSRD